MPDEFLTAIGLTSTDSPTGYMIHFPREREYLRPPMKALYTETGAGPGEFELGRLKRGRYTGVGRAAHWDTRNAQGIPVSTGVYVYVFRAGDFSATRRLTVLHYKENVMQLAICHYSLHRRWKEENWDIDRLTDEVAALGVDAIDYHAGLLGTREGVVERITTALQRTGLALSGFSLSTNFNLPDDADFDAHIEDTLAWMRIAEQLRAPACRVFGGHAERKDPGAVEQGLERVLRALRILAPEATRMGLVLALENHGGLPCTGEEQVRMIQQVDAASVRATVDVGNYMQCGQSGVDGTRVAAPFAAYVHVKDNKVRDTPNERGHLFDACTIGDGDVDIPTCLRLLKEAGFDDYVALEYEGSEPERSGVPRSVSYMRQVVSAL